MNRQNRHRTLGMLLTPSMLFVLFIFTVPVLYSIYISLHRYRVLFPSRPFVGLQNYITLFNDATIWSSLRITIYFVLVAVTIEIVLGLLIALLLNERFWGRNILRVLLLLPWAVPWVVNGIMWRWIYNTEFGTLNLLLRRFGLITSNINWLGEPLRALNMTVLADVWKETPFIAVLFLAGLQAIPEDYYNAARIDGARAWQSFVHITMPLLKPVLFVALSLRTIWAFKSFDLVYALTQGGPSMGTNLINFHIYQMTFSNLNFGYGATISIVLTAIILTITIVYFKYLLGSGSEDGY